jgi:hypothetical protein
MKSTTSIYQIKNCKFSSENTSIPNCRIGLSNIIIYIYHRNRIWYFLCFMLNFIFKLQHFFINISLCYTQICLKGYIYNKSLSIILSVLWRITASYYLFWYLHFLYVDIILLASGSLRILYLDWNTVKPVYKGHSMEPENVPFMSSCPFYTGWTNKG